MSKVINSISGFIIATMICTVSYGDVCQEYAGKYGKHYCTLQFCPYKTMIELTPPDAMGQCDQKGDDGLTEKELNKYYYLPFPDTNPELYAKCSHNFVVCINRP